jgi:very-short-patch-repair endonuclease
MWLGCYKAKKQVRSQVLERNAYQVLRFNTTAIGKDLEFLNQMVEDLETENEQLKKQCESQKVRKAETIP